LAAYDFADGVLSLLFGALAVWFVKLYARSIRATRRLIDRLHPPEPGEVLAPGMLPGWAFAVHTLIGLMLFFAMIALEETYTHTAALLFGAWAVGFNALKYRFAQQNDPTTPSAFATIDEALDRWAEPHLPLPRALGTALGFAALAGGVAIHAFNSGYAGTIALRHAGSGSTTTQIAIAAGCGALSIVFAWLYVAVTLAAQRALFDPWRYVRPEPPSRKIERWPLWIFVPIAIVGFFMMSVIGNQQATGTGTLTIEGERSKIQIGSISLLALLFGWSWGGYRCCAGSGPRRASAPSARTRGRDASAAGTTRHAGA
ncbi:MAG TPA: hypothetical protein VN803_15485, partial [Gemmatimonadales bacterium]|nr:hypothetical protein [Gemmatimonadales bacterium]